MHQFRSVFANLEHRSFQQRGLLRTKKSSKRHSNISACGLSNHPHQGPMVHLENFTYPPASPEPRDPPAIAWHCIQPKRRHAWQWRAGGGQGLFGFSNPALRRLPRHGYRISSGFLDLLIANQPSGLKRTGLFELSQNRPTSPQFESLQRTASPALAFS